MGGLQKRWRSVVFSAIAAAIFLFALPVFAQQPPPDGVKFEIVSVTVLGDKEAADRSPDFVGLACMDSMGVVRVKVEAPRTLQLFRVRFPIRFQVPLALGFFA